MTRETTDTPLAQTAGLDPGRVTVDQVRHHPDVQTLIAAANRNLEVIGYTDHGREHIERVAGRAAAILEALRLAPREAELAAIAAFFHDTGNVAHRAVHPQVSAMLAFSLLREMGMPMAEIAVVMAAISNHDEQYGGDPVNNPCAALIIADKSDVLRTRVRNPRLINFDIHDRVNYAVEKTDLSVDREHHLITLSLTIDTAISQVMEYFEIFLSRMAVARRAANFLNRDFALVVNGTKLM